MSTDDKTVQAYDDHAAEYDTHVSDPNDSIYHSYYEKPAIRAILPNLKNKKVLALGCGSGVETPWFYEHGAAEVVGVDISEGLIKIARQKFPDTDFRVMDMTELNFSDESFDVVYSSLAVHYLPDWVPMLEEVRRVLASDGVFVFSCGHPVNSAMEYSHDDLSHWALLGRRTTKDTDERVIYGDYVLAESGGLRELTMPLGSMNVTIYQRSFSKMVSEIHAANMAVADVVEPTPTEELKGVDVRTYEKLRKLPEFIIWKLRK